MGFTYNAGLRIRPPEPVPECIAGESAQDYVARLLAACSLESATSAENASGDSSPTPFNLGTLQADLAQAQEDITELQTSDATNHAAIDVLANSFASGSESYANGATSATVSLPSEGVWRPTVTPISQPLVDLYISELSENSFKVNFDAVGAAGSFSWFAYLAPSV